LVEKRIYNRNTLPIESENTLYRLLRSEIDEYKKIEIKKKELLDRYDYTANNISNCLRT
jgi:hypothetical protein